MVTVLINDRTLMVLEPVTGEVFAEHTLVAPGETSIVDDHYGGPRPDKPRQAARPRTQAEKAFLGLGPVAEAFLTGAAAAGVTKLTSEVAQILTLHQPTGPTPCWQPWNQRWRSAGGGPPTSDPSSPPTARCPAPAPPGEHWC
jgi:hypothetical protein